MASNKFTKETMMIIQRAQKESKISAGGIIFFSFDTLVVVSYQCLFENNCYIMI